MCVYAVWLLVEPSQNKRKRGRMEKTKNKQKAKQYVNA